MMQKAVAVPNGFVEAAGLCAAPVALLSAAAALPQLLKRAEAAAPGRREDRMPRQRRLWGREDGFTMAGMRR